MPEFTSPLIRILLVDDSSFMRLVVSDILQQDTQLIVIDTAADGKEAYEKTLVLKPNVVILDLVMEGYDGLYAIKNIMKDCPTPIIILSSEGNINPNTVVEALNAGAVGFVNKPRGILQSKIREIDTQLIEKVKNASKISTQKISSIQSTTNQNPHTFDNSSQYQVIVIGASTGGTGVIENILLNLPINLPIPVLIAQHIPENFVYSFAQRLNDLIGLQVKVAQRDEIVMGGKVYVMPCNTNIVLQKNPNTGIVRILFTTQKYLHFNNPSIDSLFFSVAQVYGNKAIGALLTGMGKDGVAGLGAIHQSRGITIAQDEKTSVVFGMPKAAIDEGIVKFILPSYEIAPFIVGCL
jgi:two-component system, chemotaxis family, protein-glutamate methylesterase/glutaminase